MEASSEGKRVRDPMKAIMAVVVAAIVLLVGLVGYVAYTERESRTSTLSAPIENGDKVKLDYIGRLPDGRVFDTTLLSVALDDVKYPKAFSFTKKANNSYVPFTMTAGLTGAGGTIRGFALGVIGMRVGDSKVIEVRPEDGYPLNASMLETHKLVDRIPATETMTAAEFKERFGAEPVLLRVLPHYFWGWDVQVVGNSSGIVTIKHQPYVGQVVHPFGNPDSLTKPLGWDVRVVAYDPTADGGIGATTIVHDLGPSDVYRVQGVAPDGLQALVWSVDELNGTFTLHKSDASKGYNAEITGRTLYFEVTILSVEPA